MMYDIIYFYNQFVGPLPDTYDEFVTSWYSMFPSVFDTKVCSFTADYFGKTILGKVFEKCQADKRLKDVLSFRFDLKNGFVNYHGAELLSHAHEAAYDAYMTGFAFAKILKYKEIDAVYQANKLQKVAGRKKKGEAQQALPDPNQSKNQPLDFTAPFAAAALNRVMMNQFDNCACFHMNPAKPDKGAQSIADRQKDVVWIKFTPEAGVAEASAETIASLFSAYGDFYVFKDSRHSVILNFYYIDKDAVESKSPEGFVAAM